MIDPAPVNTINLAHEPAFGLGGLAVRPATRELVAGAEAEVLEPRVMQVLVALARQRGQVVSRGDLVETCWGGRAVGEDAINRCVQAIRRLAKALGGFSVTTVARVGYRLEESALPFAKPAPPPQPPLAAPPAPEACVERRRLTVLSCNLAREGRIATRLDPEDWHAIGARYRLAVTAAVARFGGYVVRGLGEDLLVYFGYPEAKEDAAERAVRAGLAIVEALRKPTARFAEMFNIDLAARIGIHAGPVVISRVGEALEVFGEAPDVAARIQVRALPGAVMVTGAVQDLVAGLFEVDPTCEPSFGEGDEAIPLHRILAPRAASRRGAGFGACPTTAFVGREDEMHLLLGRWKRVRRGEGQLVLLMGEPGMGKTRLVEAFRGRIAGDAHGWIECAGAPLFSNTPFHAAIQMLQHVLGWGGDESPRERLLGLERTLKRSGLDPAEGVPLIGELMNLTVPQGYPPPTLPPDERRKRLLASLATWVFAQGSSRPLVIVVEDLQWVDPSTLELLRTLVEQGATAPLLLLCTARPEFQPSWRARPHHARIMLDRLSHRESRELVIGVAGRARLDDTVIEAVIERADGVPLFAEALTRLMLERDGHAGEHEIPANLHDSLGARLDRLGRARDVARLAAVLGREFSYELLAQVSALPEDELQADLAKLADADLMHVRGIPPEARYQFRHALVRDAAYEALLKGRRRELHALVARTLTERFPTLAAAQPEVLARHWSAAGEAERAFEAWALAATSANARHAYQEAERSFRHALGMLSRLPECTHRDARELELRGAFVDVLSIRKGFAAPETVAASARIADLAEKGGAIIQLIGALYGSCIGAFIAGDLRRAALLADRQLTLATRDGSEASLGNAHFSQFLIRCFRGDGVGAEEHYAKLKTHTPVAGFGIHSDTFARSWGAVCAWGLGHADLARRRMAEANAGAAESRDPFYAGLALTTESCLHVLLRDPMRAETAAAAAFAISREHGFPQYEALARIGLGGARVQQGRSGEGVALLREGVVRLREIGQTAGIPLFLTAVAQGQATEGALTDALATLEDALTLNPEELIWRPGALHCRGEVRLRLGQTELAEADFRDAIALARRITARSYGLRATTSLARLLGARGDTRSAHDLLAPAYAWFTEGFDTVDLMEAKALLDELGRTSDPRGIKLVVAPHPAMPVAARP
jgi:class 3 adenylate cyclase/tetratricopeptide (TPR) repeat protein